MISVEHFTRKSPQKREAEDALIANPARGLYGVLDGVTPLDDYKDADGHNGAYLAARIMKERLERPDGNASLAEEIAEGNRAIRRAMVEAGIDTGVRHELWATCVAAVHIRPGSISFAQLGDCMALAQYADGRIGVLTKNQVVGVSRRAKEKRERDRANGLKVEDEAYYEVPRHAWEYSRWMANTPEGYGVANGMEEVPQFIQSGEVETEGLTHLLLISDGMFHPDLPLERTMELVLQQGFEAYADSVAAAEEAKAMRPDDRSGVLIRLA